MRIFNFFTREDGLWANSELEHGFFCIEFYYDAEKGLLKGTLRS